MKKLLSLGLSFAFACAASAQINYENTTRLNEGWQFLQGDVGNLWETVRSGSGGEKARTWTAVTLPHCFNAEDAVAPDVNYYQGPGWYKTQLQINNPYPNGRTLLHFEGAGQKSNVYLYLDEVGSHVGGYDEWTVDITDALARFQKSEAAKRFKGKVPLAIRCDNSRDAELMPSDLSDFNLYGGLYRYVNLVYAPAAYVSEIYVNADGKTGSVKVSVSINGNVPEAGLPLSITLTDPSGKTVYEDNEPEATTQVVFNTALSGFKLWSPNEPNLYTCTVSLKSGSAAVTNRATFGFRHFEFIEKGPFKLNGERLLLRGTHRHEDHAGVAAAMTEEMMVREMEMIKAMGANFIRLGHYQQSRIILDLCDRLGLLVWEEIPWCRGGLGGETYREQGRRMLTNMITQHRNHPSVILWGMGNENDWPNDFPSFDKQAIRAYMKELHDLSHALDPTRLTCIRRCDFCKDIIDVYSPSIWAGWYRGVYTDYRDMTLTGIKQANRFFHAEWGGDSHAGRHAEYNYALLPDAKKLAADSKNRKDNSETYICDLIDWHLKEQENLPQLTGSAYWPFKDFSTPLRGEAPVPYVNQKGVVGRDGAPKESYYVFQSYWAEKPMIHIYGHTWPTRWGKSGEEKLLKVYSNCPQVELFLNGTSLGTKTRNSQDFPAAGLHWSTPLREGANTLRAVGERNGERVTDEITVNYTSEPFGKEAAIQARVSATEEKGVARVDIAIVDAGGKTCLTSRRQVTFGIAGDGELVIHQGTADASEKVEVANGRASVKVRTNGGESRVSVASKGLKTVFADVQE